MPPLPAVISKVRRLLEEDKGAARDLARVLASDPALVAKVLRVANSPFYGMAKRISTIQHAIVVLGFRATGSLVQALAVQALLWSNGSRGTGQYDARLFWWRALVGGICARQLAGHSSCRLDFLSEEAFHIGLLHDVGKLILARHIPDVAALVEAVERVEPNLSDYLAERRALGFDHQAVGAALLEHWRLPPLFIRAAGHHHEPLDADGNLVAYPMVGLMHLADTLCARLERAPAPGDKPIADPATMRIAAALGVSDAAITSVAAELPTLVEETVRRWGGTSP